MEQNNQEFFGEWFGGVLLVIFAICFIVFLVYTFMAYKSERDYIKMEIERSTKKSELKYWQEELRRFYIRKIPIIGDLLLDDDEYEDEYEVYDDYNK